MHEAQKRILFLCAQHSARALMAASLLAAQAREAWDIWCTPNTVHAQDIDLVRQVLDESLVPLLPVAQIAEAHFSLAWDEGIVLCSGAANQ